MISCNHKDGDVTERSVTYLKMPFNEKRLEEIINKLTDLKAAYYNCCFSNREKAKQIRYAIMELETLRCWMVTKKLAENDIY